MAANWQADVGGARSAEALLAELESLTGELIAQVGPEALEGDPACGDPDRVTALVDASARLRMVGHRLQVLRTTFLPVIDEAGLWALTGARTFATWLAATEGVARSTARREVRTATVLRDVLPAARRAALDGKIGPEHLRAMVDVAPTSQARKDALAAPALDTPFDDGRGENHDHERPDGAMGGAGTRAAGGGGVGTDAETGADGGTAVGATTADGTATGDSAADGTATGGAATAGTLVPTWEDQLLEWAGERQAEDFRGLVRYFAHRADPEADERGLRKATEKEYLNVSPTMDGFHVAGFLTPEHGELVTTALGSVTGAPAAQDDRTAGQRRAQGLADLARTALDNAHTGTGAAVRPHLNVSVSWTELRHLTHHTDHTADDATGTLFSPLTLAGTHTGRPPGGPTAPPGASGTPVMPGTPGAPGLSSTSGRPGTPRTPKTPARSQMPGTPGAPEASLPSGRTGVTGARPHDPAVITGTHTPVPISLLRRITCDCEVTRIVFGPDGAVLDVGRAQRTLTGPMRRAVIARDQHCVWPGCDQPPARCEVHHAVRHWADGGTTSADNAALLCWHHHDRVDGQHITMHWTGNAGGTRHSGWTLTDRNGHEITLAGRPPLPSVREPASAASREARPPATTIYRPPTERRHTNPPDVAATGIRPRSNGAPGRLAA